MSDHAIQVLMYQMQDADRALNQYLQEQQRLNKETIANNKRINDLQEKIISYNEALDLLREKKNG